MSEDRRPIKFLNREQVAHLFSVIEDPRDRALFAVIYHHGLRTTEATLLKLTDVDLTRRRIYITRLKNGHSGEWPLMENTAQAVLAYLPARRDTGPALFTGRQGGLQRQRIQQLFRQYAQKAGLDTAFTVRCLRHSIATHLLEAGFGIEYVQAHLGHVNIQNTLIYARLTDRRREAVFQQIEQSPEIVKV